MVGALQNLARLSHGVEARARRRSRRRDGDSKPSSSKRRSGKKDVSMFYNAELAAFAKPVVQMGSRVVVTSFTFTLIAFAVVFTNIAHLVVFALARTGAAKLSKRDEHVVLGRLLRGSIARVVVDWNPFWNVRFTSEVPIRKLPQRCIFMSNHLSFSDPFMLCSAQRPLESKYVAMSTLFDIPLAGRTALAAGDMGVHFKRDPKHGRWRTKTGTRDPLMARARMFLEQDVSVTVYPEGRVSRTGEMVQFRKGFFHLAREMGVPIVPVAIWGSQDAWPTYADPHLPSQTPYLGAAKVQIRIGAPIPVEGKTLRELVVETYGKIQEMRNALPNFDLDPALATRDPGAVFDTVPRCSLTPSEQNALGILGSSSRRLADVGADSDEDDDGDAPLGTRPSRVPSL